MTDFSSKLERIGSGLSDRLPDLLITLVVGLVAVEAIILILGYVLRVANIPNALKPLLYSLARAFLWVVLFLVVIQTLGLDNVLVAVTGSSVILALFLSTGIAPLVTDTLAGLSLAADANFQPGARVQVGSNKTEGVVATMDIRKTRVMTKDGRMHVLPNSEIDKNEWVVLEPKVPQKTQRSILKRGPKRSILRKK